MDGAITNSSSKEEGLSIYSRNQLDISLLKSNFPPAYFTICGNNLDSTSSSVVTKIQYFLDESKALLRKSSSVDFENFQVEFSIWLWNLEICRGPHSISFHFSLGETRNLKWLKMLYICHLSIRCLPPEIGSLKKLVELDLSFNELKNLPDDIGELYALKFLRAANNRLVDLPPSISSLRSLEKLDLSGNKLSLSAQLKLASMQSLKCLNIQYDTKIHHFPQNSFHQSTPSLDLKLGDGEVISMEDMDSSLVEVKAQYAAVHRGVHGHRSYNDCHINSPCFHPESFPASKCSSSHRIKKGDRQYDSLQQRARQERLNYSRRWRLNRYCEDMIVKMDEEHNSSKSTLSGKGQSNIQLCDNEENLVDYCAVGEKLHSLDCVDNESSELSNITIDNSCLTESTSMDKESSSDNESVSSEPVVNSSSVRVKHKLKSKRHCDRELDNPKPSKFRRPVNDSSVSWKYNTESFCSIDDRLPDGFFDAGRDRPFLSLEEHEKSFSPDSREVILLDRYRDEELDAIIFSAQRLLSGYRRTCFEENTDFEIDNLKRASILALFVSDCFGGSDRSSSVRKLRKGMVGSKKQQPFVCTCLSINEHDNGGKQAVGMETNFNFKELCDNYLRLIKIARNSNVVPIGTVRFGVCRHRAVLMKYLCDRADPPIPCELVRGYLDFSAHAWNAIHIKKGNSLIRMVVDTCSPTDIREETDPEYYSRYVPLCRVNLPLTTENSAFFGSPLSSLILSHETESTKPRHVFRCRFGTLDAVAKVRNLESYRASQEELKAFEYSFLGEVRMLGALRKHSCIVEIFAHRLSSKWAPAVGGKENRLLQAVIVMEYIKGGSVKEYVEKLSKRGEKHVPVDIALHIARSVACALVALHSKHIIHRDIKSENVLIDLESKRIDGTPIVKLADFDVSVPLHSFMHTCCNSHFGIHAPNVCIGTPRWMAPEVVQAMHHRNLYGLEVDIWSYGCLLYELLTLQVPYYGRSESEIYGLLQMKRRPKLTPELEALVLYNDYEQSNILSDDMDKLKLLTELFYDCTSSDPSDRPTAQCIYDKLCEDTSQNFVVR